MFISEIGLFFNFRFNLVLFFLICLSNLSTTKFIAEYKSSFTSSARRVNFFVGIVTSIISAKVNNNNCGNIRLSIICDILGQEETIYLLLTNQEQSVLERLKQKLNIPEEQFNLFLKDLDKLNDISNGKNVRNYNFNPITETIISKYSTILVERNLLLKMFKEQKSQEFIPVGSFFTRTKSYYPLQIHNDFMQDTKLIVTRNLFQIENLSSTASNIMQNSLEDINEDLKIIVNYLPNCPLELIYGLQNNDQKSIQVFLNEYVKYLMNKDLSLKEICEVNDILKYLRKVKLERNITIKFENQINNICIFQRKKYLSRLINKESVEFIRLGGNYRIELPTTIYYPCYETKENQESKEITWYIKIPKSDQDITPSVIIQNELGQVYVMPWDNLIDGAKIIEDEDFLIYEINGFGNSQLTISISINSYLTAKTENVARRKEKKYN